MKKLSLLRAIFGYPLHPHHQEWDVEVPERHDPGRTQLHEY
jgi:hypothetical protein